MATTRISLIELLRKTQVEGDVDFLREAVRVVIQARIDREAGDVIGAEPCERNSGRRTYRYGNQRRRRDTQVGTVELKVPKLRQGSFFPSLLEPRRRTERALPLVVQEAYIHGVSTRKVDHLVKALGRTGISRSEVSRVCQELDEQVKPFRNRPLLADYPCLWLDATFHKVREAGQVHAMAPGDCGRNSVQRRPGGTVLDLGPAEDGAFCLECAVLTEQNDEWAVGRRYFSQESMARLNRTDPEPQQPEAGLGRAS